MKTKMKIKNRSHRYDINIPRSRYGHKYSKYKELLSMIMFELKKSVINTAQKMKFSITDFFSKCDQIRSFLRIASHLLKKTLIVKFIFCADKSV